MPALLRRWGGHLVTSWPSNSTVPVWIGISPETARPKVLLPAPFGPRMATMLPRGTSIDRSNKARCGP